MEYIFALLGLLLVWGIAYWFVPAKGKRLAFWFGFVNIALVVYSQFVLQPYRLERIVFDLSQI